MKSIKLLGHMWVSKWLHTCWSPVDVFIVFFFRSENLKLFIILIALIFIYLFIGVCVCECWFFSRCLISQFNFGLNQLNGVVTVNDVTIATWKIWMIEIKLLNVTKVAWCLSSTEKFQLIQIVLRKNLLLLWTLSEIDKKESWTLRWKRIK